MKKIILLCLLTIYGCSDNSEEQVSPCNYQPTLTTGAVTQITRTTATLNGVISIISENCEVPNNTEQGFVYSTSIQPTLDDAKINVNGTNISSYLENLIPNTTYYVRSFLSNNFGQFYGNEVSFTTSNIQLPTITTTTISNVTQFSVNSGGNISSDGGSDITHRGIVWSTSPNPTYSPGQFGTIEIGSGIGSFTSNISLNPNTQYYVRAFAKNSIGIIYGNEINFITQSSTAYSSLYPLGTFFCGNLVTSVIDVINPITGKTWMDRNLGAEQVNSLGDLYQWGRRADGHQCRNNLLTTGTQSSIDQPSYSNFILSTSAELDWRNPKNDNLWQGIDGVNNPCPIGYRIPTITELSEERSSWSSDNASGALSSPLGLVRAGRRDYENGSMTSNNTMGSYWSNTFRNLSGYPYAWGLYIFTSSAQLMSYPRGEGLSVRCIKN